MHTVHQPPGIPGDPPPVVPYFRRLAAERAVRELAAWYAGGLPPDPLAA